MPRSTSRTSISSDSSVHEHLNSARSTPYPHPTTPRHLALRTYGRRKKLGVKANSDDPDDDGVVITAASSSSVNHEEAIVLSSDEEMSPSRRNNSRRVNRRAILGAHHNPVSFSIESLLNLNLKTAF